jgi:integrase
MLRTFVPAWSQHPAQSDATTTFAVVAGSLMPSTNELQYRSSPMVVGIADSFDRDTDLRQRAVIDAIDMDSQGLLTVGPWQWAGVRARPRNLWRRDSDFSPNRATGDRQNFEPHPLTPEQISDVCAALRGERPSRDGKPLPAYSVYALMVEFAAYTGLRASELAGLEVGDLYFSPVPVAAQPKCSVHVERTKTKAKRAGEGWIVGTPKSKRSRRSVPLPGWLAAKMADCLANIHPRAAEPDAPLWPGGASRAARAGQAVSEWLTALDWSEPVELGTFYRYAFARALRAVGLPVTTPARNGMPALHGVRLHDLRHTAAVAWLAAGVPVVQVSRWLGHAQPTITINVYGDWVPETVENPLPEAGGAQGRGAVATPGQRLRPISRPTCQARPSATDGCRSRALFWARDA